ncbi:MAG: DUF2480 family protein [Saprospiraceae bacterium]|nr:DUF2480 family protein [Saprospiraceae bacterium]MCB9313327.1 DUF2480 family protein [Lewinellaceae bacterium]
MSQDDAPLVNRVAQSGLITLNLEEYYPREPVVVIDLKDYLFQGLILREKEYREQLKSYDWTSLAGKHLVVHCSTDAIIPVWAYMLVTALATPHALTVSLCQPEEFIVLHYQKALADLDVERYRGERIVIKGCSDHPVPPFAYALLTAKLQPVAQSIMFGEPCSTVPIFKRPRELRVESGE